MDTDRKLHLRDTNALWMYECDHNTLATSM